MAFNHYAKIKRILDQQPAGWSIKKINEETKAQNFRGETVTYPLYYRIYDLNNVPIKYCKFQQLNRLADILGIPVEAIEVIEENS